MALARPRSHTGLKLGSMSATHDATYDNEHPLAHLDRLHSLATPKRSHRPSKNLSKVVSDSSPNRHFEAIYNILYLCIIALKPHLERFGEAAAAALKWVCVETSFEGNGLQVLCK